MNKLPSVDTLKTELNGVMNKYDFSVHYFNVSQDGDEIVIGVIFTQDRRMENENRV